MIVPIKRLVLAALTLAQVVFVFSSLERTAYAYVDPGSGMLIVQFLSSALGGGIFFLRKRLRRIFFPVKSATDGAQQTETHI